MFLANRAAVMGASALRASSAIGPHRSAARAQPTCSWNWRPVVTGMRGLPKSG